MVLHSSPEGASSFRPVSCLRSLVSSEAGVPEVLRVSPPEEGLELGLAERPRREHLVHTRLLRLLAAEAGGDVDGTHAGGAVEEQLGGVHGQHAGEGEQAGVREAEEGGVEVAVYHGGHRVLVGAGQRRQQRGKAVEADARVCAVLERCRQDNHVVGRLGVGLSIGGEAQLEPDRLSFRAAERNTSL